MYGCEGFFPDQEYEGPWEDPYETIKIFDFIAKPTVLGEITVQQLYDARHGAIYLNPMDGCIYVVDQRTGKLIKAVT